MLWLARASQDVILARKNNELRIYTIMPEPAEPLLSVFNRNAVVVIGIQNQRWCLDVLGVLERRSVPVLVEIIEQESVEVVLVAVGAVARSVVADEVGN